MSFELDARVTALEARAEAVEILLAEVFGQFSASVDHDAASFQAGLHELCRRYRIDPEEADAGRRDAAVVLLRIMDAYKGKVCDWDRATQLQRS
jgi:hypothetical protein